MREEWVFTRAMQEAAGSSVMVRRKWLERNAPAWVLESVHHYTPHSNGDITIYRIVPDPIPEPVVLTEYGGFGKSETWQTEWLG